MKWKISFFGTNNVRQTKILTNSFQNQGNQNFIYGQSYNFSLSRFQLLYSYGHKYSSYELVSRNHMRVLYMCGQYCTCYFISMNEILLKLMKTKKKCPLGWIKSCCLDGCGSNIFNVFGIDFSCCKRNN